MNQEQKGRQILRPSLEACFQSQEKIRKHLDELEQGNRPLKDQSERDTFFRELTFSTLGLGRDLKVKYFHHSILLIRTDLETFARWLAYRKENPVATPLFLRRPDGNATSETFPVEIKDLWSTLRDHLFSVFPAAIDRASSISKETEASTKSKGYKFERVK